MGKVINFPHKNTLHKDIELKEIMEALMAADRMLDAYSKKLTRHDESKEKRKRYLQDLDEFEELIHGNHPKLVD